MRLTFTTGLCDGIGCTLAHHLGNVDRTVNTVSQGDGTEHGLSLQLCWKSQKKNPKQLKPMDKKI